MNVSVTWASYALIVSVCLFFYYSVVFLILYRKKLFATSVTSPNIRQETIPAEEVDTVNNVDLFGEESIAGVKQEESPDVVNVKSLSRSFADELEAFTQASSDNITKDELIEGLQGIILKYPSIKTSESKYQLSQLITMLTETNCSLHLSADELGDLWNG